MRHHSPSSLSYRYVSRKGPRYIVWSFEEDYHNDDTCASLSSDSLLMWSGESWVDFRRRTKLRLLSRSCSDVYSHLCWVHRADPEETWRNKTSHDVEVTAKWHRWPWPLKELVAGGDLQEELESDTENRDKWWEEGWIRKTLLRVKEWYWTGKKKNTAKTHDWIW